MKVEFYQFNGLKSKLFTRCLDILPRVGDFISHYCDEGGLMEYQVVKVLHVYEGRACCIGDNDRIIIFVESNEMDVDGF